MATYLIIIIVFCVVDVLLAFCAFMIADDRGHDPMSAFMAPLFFSILGFGMVLLLSRRKQERIEAPSRYSREAYYAPSPSHSQFSKQAAIIFYAKRTKKYHMRINDNPIGMDQFDEVFNAEGVAYYKEEKDFMLTEITKDIAKHLLEWD